MAGLPVLSTGFILGPIPGSAKAAVHGLQAMRISFADNAVLEEVLKHGTDLKISFGKSMVRDNSKMSSFGCPKSSTFIVEDRGVYRCLGSFANSLGYLRLLEVGLWRSVDGSCAPGGVPPTRTIQASR
jgi:hypothetical protein